MIFKKVSKCPNSAAMLSRQKHKLLNAKDEGCFRILNEIYRVW